MEKEALSSTMELREIVSSVARNLQAGGDVPVATYRIQLNHLFTFAAATSVLSYLHELGISHCYASPYFTAKKGSLHGYDIQDHNTINPEIGTEGDYTAFIDELNKYGMGHILDIVPNHMSIVGNENLWWMDVLENGRSSVYADYFDIDWKPVEDELENKVLLPILGNQYGQVLENQELTLVFEEAAFFILYFDNRFPVDPVSYTKILSLRLEELEKQIGKDHPHLQELLSIITALNHLPLSTEDDSDKMIERRREKEIIKRRLWVLYSESTEVRSFIKGNMQIFNGEKGSPRSFDLLDDLLKDQAYRLSHWRVATEEINYRRFFDVNELAAIRMEDPCVFKEAHRLVFRLIREKKVTGLRVDHPDGLYDPVEYFRKLQKAAFVILCLHEADRSREGNGQIPSQVPDESALEKEIGCLYEKQLSQDPLPSLTVPFFVIGEKILIKGERIPEEWPVCGTVGYLFLNPLNGIFVDSENAKAFDDIYSRFIGSKLNYQELLYEKKKLVMHTTMSGEINTLGHRLNRLSEKDRHTRDFSRLSLTTAIIETIACFPVYRTYVTSSGANERDQRYIAQAVSSARRKNPALNVTIFDFLERILLLQYPQNLEETDKAEWVDFAMRFQQVTAPVMAKGMEDTAFYVYNRFVSLNEVGGSPEKFGTSLDAFHGQNIERSKLWRYGLLATSTHDTKRSEDARARLNVLSEIPNVWRQNLLRWSRMNKKRKSVVDGRMLPDRNDEYLLYQSLIALWPHHPMDGTEYGTFKKRIEEYMLKAVREAKVNTSWISPNATYEHALLEFIEAILSPSGRNPFVKDFEALQRKITYYGMFNSLSQTLLKITSPGTPDFYQGTELWDLSFVDPDNRRLVDFDLRKGMLRALKEKIDMAEPTHAPFARELLHHWQDGSIKLYVTYKGLNYRRDNHRLFMDGGYTPLVVDGDRSENVCAFARQDDSKAVVVIVPRFFTRLIQSTDEVPLGEEVWGDTGVIIPDGVLGDPDGVLGDPFCNILTGEKIRKTERDQKKMLRLAEIFANFPLALLESVEGTI